MITEAPHPFYPLGVELVGYVANDWDMSAIFGVFGGALLTLYAGTRAITNKLNADLPVRDQVLVVWFVLCSASYESL